MGLKSVLGRAALSHRRRAFVAALVGALVVVAVMVCVVSFAFAADTGFPDVYNTNPYYAAITDLAARGIIAGFPNGNFGPGDPVTRQQFAKMVVLAGKYPVSESNVCPFTDVVLSGPSSFYPDNYVAVCAANGITVGKTATTFDPYSNITRYQAVSMVVRAADDLHPGLLATPPVHWVGTGAWENDATHGANAARAEYNGLLHGLDLGALNPTGYITRGEVAQILYNLIGALTPPTTTTTASTTTTTMVTTTTSSTTTTSTSTTTTLATHFEDVGGNITSAPAAVSWGENRLDVFARGSSGQLMHEVFNNWWDTNWLDMGGDIKADSDPAAIQGAAHAIDVFVRWTDGTLRQKYYSASTWSQWVTVDVEGTTLTSDVAVCSPETNFLFMAARGSDGAVWYATCDSGTWSTWTSIGGAVKSGSSPAVVSWGSGRIDVFVRGADNKLKHRAWLGTGWGNWEDLGGALTSNPTVCSRMPDSIDVFARGSGNTIWRLSYNAGNWSNWTDLGGGTIDSSPAVVSWDVNRIDLLARSSSNTLLHRWWSGAVWLP